MIPGASIDAAISLLSHQIPQTTLTTLVARRRIVIAISHLLEAHKTKTRTENPNTRVLPLPPLPNVIAIASSVAFSFCFLSCFRFCFGCFLAHASSLPHLRNAATTINQTNHRLSQCDAMRPPLAPQWLDSTRLESKLNSLLILLGSSSSQIFPSEPSQFPHPNASQIVVLRSSLTLDSRKSTSTRQNPQQYIGSKTFSFFTSR